MNKKAYTQGYIKGLQLAKKANGWSEGLSWLNPINLNASPLSMPAAGLTAALTKARSLKDQAKHDISDSNIWKDILIPGVGTYNSFKRIGSSMRSPEMMKLKAKLKK